MDNNDFAPVDATKVPRFSDIATFMRTKRMDMSEILDIGLCGVPFDIGVNYRAGTREAPGAVRHASRLIRNVHPTLGLNPYKICKIADIGDAPLNPLDFDQSIKSITEFYTQIKKLKIRPVSIGGDHTIPTPILRALASDEPVGILQIDSHADTLDEMGGTKINHATFMRRGLEEGLIDPNRVVQIGLRGSRFSEDDIQFGYDHGFTMITFDDYENMGRQEAINKILQTLKEGRTYITIDIDGLDPSYCPGTAVPEIGGLTPRDTQVILRSLIGLNIIGADISEVAPCYDPTGITSVTAANLMFELTCLIANSIDKSR